MSSVREKTGEMAGGDEELVRSYLESGQRQALEVLVRRHIKRVRALVAQMVLDESVADDLTQDVFLRAFRGLGSFNGKSRFATWLFRVAMNTTYSYLDRRSRSPVEYRPLLPEPSNSADSRPEQAVLQREFEEEVETALNLLKPKLRSAIVLTCLQQLSVREAAEIEGCLTATMYWRIHEARKLLKQQLGDYLLP